MPELAWGWPEICCVLVWRLAPRGTIITREDLHALPMDRVMIEERTVNHVRFRWVSIEEARRIRDHDALTGERAGVSEMQGRWQKLACVLLWKLAKDGISLTVADRANVPADQVLLQQGHANDLELRFVPRGEAQAIARFEAFHEGKSILERA